ncbi:heavy-metal-associated domain-containing protein [Peptostreptococcus faecalis]|uniref:heavy-metal-associated domain-containing protein n=1 Tax=Peptostreptococcus faecalis TaxID=2045015 RepID=UPI000C7BCD7F|nr:heavy-metal-associated domain-containing protein [Peptostreptococcus faecalis]
MKKRLVISGMHCENCAKGLNAVLTEDIVGLKVENISVEDGFADIVVDDDVSDNELKAAVEELGFKLLEIK